MVSWDTFSNNPLIVSIITALIGGIGFLIKKYIDSNTKNKIESKRLNNENNITQNFNNGISYNDVKQIAEDVCDKKLLDLKKEILKMEKKEE